MFHYRLDSVVSTADKNQCCTGTVPGDSDHDDYDPDQSFMDYAEEDNDEEDTFLATHSNNVR
jgi:hypothetical protein